MSKADDTLMRRLIDSVGRTNALLEVLIHSQHAVARMTNLECPICQRAIERRAVNG